jgi:hypothetical protein
LLTGLSSFVGSLFICIATMMVEILPLLQAKKADISAATDSVFS